MSFEQAPPAVFGYAVLPRVVLDGDFTDAVSFQVGEYGDVAVEFAEYAYVFCDFAAIDFEAAVKVVYVNARYKSRDPVKKFGGARFCPVGQSVFSSIQRRGHNLLRFLIGGWGFLPGRLAGRRPW